MQKKKVIIILSIIVILLGLGGTGVYLLLKEKEKPVEIDKDFSKLDLEGITNIMFVAHPDDDAIWGGAHLLKDGEKYLVVCITCGTRKDRALEFETAMEKTKSKYLMLGWPDKTNGEKDKWETSKAGIKEDIENILALKDWDLIVTHNPEGEYGHIHHIMTNEMVTDLAEKSKLYYFGKYYTKKALEEVIEDMIDLEENVTNEKTELIDVYKTQAFVFDMFGHMFGYESWVSYEDWYKE